MNLILKGVRRFGIFNKIGDCWYLKLSISIRINKGRWEEIRGERRRNLGENEVMDV